MGTWLATWGLLIDGVLIAYAILRALQGAREPVQTDCRVLPQIAPTGLGLVRVGYFVDDGGAYIDGEAVRL